MATVGVTDPSLMSLVERDAVAGAARGAGKLARGVVGKLGGGSRKQEEYAGAASKLGRSLAQQAAPHLKRAGMKLLSRGLVAARKRFLGFKSGGRVYKKMCKGGKCKKRYQACFKKRDGKLVKFQYGGKVRHM